MSFPSYTFLTAKILNLLKEMGDITTDSRSISGGKCNILITAGFRGILFGCVNVSLFHINRLYRACPAYDTGRHGTP